MNENAINYNNNAKNILNAAKQIITEEVEKAGYKVDRIILFGSRARGDFKENSDYDFFVMINQNISYRDRDNIITKIKRIMARLDIDSDIFITSSNEIKENNNVGNITYYALKYGLNI